jgi:RNA polymerase primary sigma factor
VTGAGKTRLALAAAQRELNQGGRVAILVPTLDLVQQWVREVRNHVKPRSGPVVVGQFGGGASGSLQTSQVIVTTVQSASRWQILPTGMSGLLIADECHHYGARGWSTALEDGFGHRLGLTATYDREDEGIENYLDPYFGGVCYSVDYEEALADGVIADFKIAFVGVAFTPSEQSHYDESAERAGKYRHLLVRDYGVTPEPFGEFMRQVARLRTVGEGEGARLAGFYLSAFVKRRAVMAAATAKYERLLELAPAVRAADRTIVFAQTQAAAATAVDRLSTIGVRGAVLDATMDISDRKQVFAGFEDGTHELVAAPRLLDEGIDVPAADLAIVLASSRSKRQLIQRMGRVVRRKEDGRLARLAIVFVQGTAEDPNDGAHEDFLDTVVEAAEDVSVYRSGDTSSAIVSYLNDL